MLRKKKKEPGSLFPGPHCSTFSDHSEWNNPASTIPNAFTTA